MRLRIAFVGLVLAIVLQAGCCWHHCCCHKCWRPCRTCCHPCCDVIGAPVTDCGCIGAAY